MATYHQHGEMPGIHRQESIRRNIGPIIWLADKFFLEEQNGEGRESEFYATFQKFTDKCKFGEEQTLDEKGWLLEITAPGSQFGRDAILHLRMVDGNWQVKQVECTRQASESREQCQDLVPHLQRSLDSFFTLSSDFNRQIGKRLLFKQFCFEEDFLA